MDKCRFNWTEEELHMLNVYSVKARMSLLLDIPNVYVTRAIKSPELFKKQDLDKYREALYMAYKQICDEITEKYKANIRTERDRELAIDLREPCFRARMLRKRNICETTFRARLRKGHSFEEALESPIGKLYIKKASVDHKGKHYESYIEMCREFKQKPSTVRSRMRRDGHTLEEALMKKPQVHHKGEIADHLGNTFPTIKDMCIYHQIDINTYRYRKNKGLPIKECLDKNSHHNGTKDYVPSPEELYIDGHQFHNLKEVSDFYGISHNALQKRISYLHRSPQEAVYFIPKRNRVKKGL